MVNPKIYILDKGSKCPKCELGKGLRESSCLELGWTGWENYKFLHCDTCGAYFISRKEENSYRYLDAKSISSDE